MGTNRESAPKAHFPGKCAVADHNQLRNASYTIKVTSNVLLVDILGTWSRETNLQYMRDVKRHAKPLIGYRWGMLVLLDEWSMSTQDSVPVIRELSQWCYDHGITHCALVYKRDALKKFQLSKMMVTKAEGYQTQYFEALLDACHWLNQAGFSLDLAECERLKNYRHH